MKRVLLIDLSHIFWTMWHASADQELSAAYERTIGTIHKLRSGFDAEAVCCDAPPYLRKEILHEYKSQRDTPPPVAIEQLNRVKARCEADGLLVWECRGFEADDLVATACAVLPNFEIVIGSNDKDLCQLITNDGRITVEHPLKGTRFDRAKVIETFGVSPDMLGDLLALWGDASDNIPGIPGVGPKTGAKLLLEFGTLEGVLTHADDIPQPALKKNIETHGPAARLARKVIELRTDAPIDVADLWKKREVKKLVETNMDESLDSLGPEVAPPNDQEEQALMNKIAALQPTGITKAPPEPKKSTGLATYEGPEFDRGLEPATLDAAWRLAGGMVNSRLYTRFPNQEAVWAIIVRGREMGLGALTALDCMHLIEGKPALHAHLIIARAKQHPECMFFQLVSSGPDHAEYLCQRKGDPDPTRLRYTLEQARQAGRSPKSPRTEPVWQEKNGKMRDVRGQWEKIPEEMLRKTCGVQLTRIVFPESALGLYAIEELDDSYDKEAT